MAEWLRRLTRNQMGSSRVGSNPTHSDVIILKKGVITLLTYTWKTCMHSTNYSFGRCIQNNPYDLHGTHKGKKKNIYFFLYGMIQYFVNPSLLNKKYLANNSCDGRVVKAFDSKSNGIFPRRFESYSQRYYNF